MIVESEAQNGSVLLQSNKWLAAGIVHGFLGKPKDPKKPQLAQQALQQKHTDVVLDFRGKSARAAWLKGLSEGELPVGDGFILPLDAHDMSGKYAIITADCLPVFVRSDAAIACVHAGWRGLASGILWSACALLQESRHSVLEVLIGPAAGELNYQVGPEVIEAIGETARYRIDSTPGKYLLNSAATAIAQIQSVATVVNCEVVPVCTMTDSRFFSYRREGPKAGRNYSFIEF